MSLPRRLLRSFTSVKTTAVLLAVVALVLFLNIAVPQAVVLGEEGLAAVVGESAWKRFLLIDLRLGYLSTSPVFFVVLGLFFLNLALVLGQRVAPTWHKLRLRPRSEAGLRAWARTPGHLEAPLPPGWDLAHVVSTLRGFGYHVVRVGERTFQGVKHRTAALGFLLFHLSFFLFFAGGALIYSTRFVGTVRLVEGQTFDGDYAGITRRPPVGGPPPLRFTVVEVDPRFLGDDPVHLGVRFVFHQAGADVPRQARVNVPAEWGPTSVLVQLAGVAPVFWLQDKSGYTVDRVAVPATTRSADATQASLADGRTLVVIHPPAADAPFPTRDELASLALDLAVFDQSDPDNPRLVFEGALRPGEAADLGDARLVLEESRYWVGVQVVSERGGGILVAGFVIGILGLVWRLGLYRREVALVWDEAGDEPEPRVYLVGHSEYFPERFSGELAALFKALVETPSSPS